MNVVFTDIDGVLCVNGVWRQRSIDLYNKLCSEFNLRPVVTSSMRLRHSRQELLRLLKTNGVLPEVLDTTDSFPSEGRGREIEDWLFNNSHDKFVILDDSVRDILSWGLPNVVRCRGYIGFSDVEFEQARQLLQ